MSKISKWIFWGVVACAFLNSVSLVGAAVYPDISGGTAFEWITNVTFGEIDNDSDQDPIGYGDYSALSTDVTSGATYDISVTILAGGSDYITVFIDWNQDGDFGDPGEAYPLLEGAFENGPHLGAISVPKNAVSGATRMRVVLKWDGAPPSVGDISFGEAEDYTINVKRFPWAMFQGAFTAHQVSVPVPAPDPVPSPATFSISSSSFNNNAVIPIEYTLYGINTSPQLSWVNAPAGTASYLLTVLDPDGGDWLHWKVNLAGNITSLVENAGDLGGVNLPAGSMRYLNSWARLDYDGPRPPAGTGVHHYHFKVTALDAGGGELGSATIIGTYEQP